MKFLFLGKKRSHVSFLEQAHLIALRSLALHLNLGAGPSALELLTGHNVQQLSLEVRLVDREGLQELLAPRDLTGLVDDEGHGAGHHAQVGNIAIHLRGGLLVIEVDVRDGQTLLLLRVLIDDDLTEVLLGLLALGIVGDGDEDDVGVLLRELGELLVDAIGTLVEGVEVVQHVDLAGLEVDLLALDGLEELQGGGGLAEAGVVAVGGHVNGIRHLCVLRVV